MKKIVSLDGKSYRTHKDALRALGINYFGKAHREGAYALFDGWRVWFPNMIEQSGDWLNRLSEGGTVIEENYIGKGEPHDGRDIPDSGTRLIVFPKLEEGYVFKGVFKIERANVRIRQYRRCAKSCEIRFDVKLG